MIPTFPSDPCQARQALREAEAHIAAGEAVARLHDDVHIGLRQFTDTFVDAIAGDFLAEADERRLRDNYRNQPATLRVQLARNHRALAAQRALHTLYNKLQSGAAITIEERSLAEHAQDLCQTYAEREIDRRTQHTSR